MARWDHADLLSMDAKVVLYPEYCSTKELEYWAKVYKNDPFSLTPIVDELEKRTNQQRKGEIK